MSTSNAGAIGILTLAGVWQASVLGLPVLTLAIGTGFTLLGLAGRAGFEISSGTKPSKIAALLAGGLVSAPTIAVLCIAFLKLIGIQNDTASLISLVFFGFLGAPVIKWLLNTLSTMLAKFGVKLPQIGQGGEIQP